MSDIALLTDSDSKKDEGDDFVSLNDHSHGEGIGV